MTAEEKRARNGIASAKWAQKNRAKRAEFSRKWRAEHPGYEKKLPSRTTNEGKAKRRAWAKTYRKSHAAEINARNHNYRARQAAAAGEFTLAEFKAVCVAQKGRCAHCAVKAKLTADHKTPLSRGGSNLIVNIQGLCLGCNMKKHASIEQGHQFNLWDRAA